MPRPRTASPSLEVCISRYNRPHARYLASVDWDNRPRYSHLILGARDASNVVWVQVPYEAPTASGTDSLRFTVSDVSSYPLIVAVYDLSDAAFRTYRENCQRHQECYFQPDGDGVSRLSDEVRLSLAADMWRDRRCPAVD